MSYADIFVQSQEDSQTLPKFLAPLAQKIHAKMGKEIGLRKTPKVRFRVKKEKRNSADILSLIHELDQKYGLSQENN
jgi:ribosome-binding factor A